MKKFQERMQGVLPPEELPSFFGALEAMGKAPRKSLRIRRDFAGAALGKWTPEELRKFGIPVGDPVPWYRGGYFFDLPKMVPHPSRHPAIAAGIIFIQEAGALEVAPALEVTPTDLVLDLCAAPGAKSTHLGEYLGASSGPETGGWLVANDLVRDRAKLLDVILARHGIGNSTVFNLEPHRLAEHFPEVFDRILVDAPCSGESLFAKREEKRSDVTHKEVERCALRQRAILESAWRMLAAGGRLVYSTCAYSRTENENLVDGFMSSHADAEKISECRRFPHRDGVPGGYFAVLAKEGEGSATREGRGGQLRLGIREIGSRGLVRNGRIRWDGAPDSYAVLMDRKWQGPIETDQAIAFGLSEAEKLLAGTAEKIVSDARILFTWEKEKIAGAYAGKLVYPRGRLR
jgi:16S rRNA C967 or C1407 C5-methylase (RsmB/RsmF family)